MRYKDYYEILGVERGADAAAIKRAYRKSARKYHPDVSKEKNAEERFKEAQEAYEVLRDPDKRAAYDQLGRDYRGGQQFRPPPDWGQRVGAGRAGAPGDMHGFSDFFATLFGGTQQFGGAQNLGGAQFGGGQDADAGVLEVGIEEAFTGVKQRVTLNENGRTRAVEVSVPAGVTDGQALRIPRSGGRGSLIFRVRLRAHPWYSLSGKDVQLELPLAPWEAALGAKVAVPTLGGTVGVTVPAGAQSGQKLRLRGRGFPGSPPGDQIVIVKLVTPPADTPSARKAYERMQDELPFDPRSGWP